MAIVLGITPGSAQGIVGVKANSFTDFFVVDLTLNEL
jgi:hypothetical protein